VHSAERILPAQRPMRTFKWRVCCCSLSPPSPSCLATLLRFVPCIVLDISHDLATATHAIHYSSSLALACSDDTGRCLALCGAGSVCERTICATYAALQAARVWLGWEQRSKLSCLGAVLMNQYRSQDKLSWTFTPPPMAPRGRTTPTGSTAILAARSGMVFVARVARSMQCMETRFTRDNHSPPPPPQYAAYQSITIDTHALDRLHRELFNNRLIGSIPSSIGSLVNIEVLYVNPTDGTHTYSFSNHRQEES